MRVGALPVLGVVVVTLAVSCGGDDDEKCDVAALQAELDGASAGDTVQMTGCVAEGNLTVPAGVVLDGTDGSRVVANEGVGVRLEPSADPATPTTVLDVAVESGGAVGILARGSGHVVLSRVTVEASRGYAVGVESATELTMDDVELLGPVTPDNADDEAFLTPNDDEMATYGLVLLAVETATISRTTITGFAQFGAVVLDQTSDGTPAEPTRLDWTEGSIQHTLGTGLYVSGSTSNLTDLAINATLRGLRGTPTYAAVFTGDASDVTTLRLKVCDNADFGLLQEGGVAAHTDLEVTNNGTGGLAAGMAMSLSLDGTSSILSNNGAFNVLVRESSNVTLRDATIENAVVVPSNLASSRELGDGVQLVQTYDNVVLEDLVIRDNGRAGLVVDLGGGGEAITFSNVMVHSREAELGVGGGMVDTATWMLTPAAPDGVWDAGILRDTTATMVDESWTDDVAVAGITTPSMIARPAGLTGITTPSM